MEVNQVTPQKAAGFATRNANKERIAKEEEELKKMQEGQQQPAASGANDDDDGIEPSSPEEASFKKRYGDLRRHTQKQQLEMQKQIDELQAQLAASTTKQIKFPKSEAELDQWAREFPDVAKIVETIAMKKAKEMSSALEDRLKKLDEMQIQTLKEKAEVELMRLHPDFDRIRETTEFHDWVESQPKWVQQALYENETDAISAARAIDLYKADMGITTKKATKRDSDKEAAKSVATSSKAGVDSTGDSETIYESQVAKMSANEYEKYQDKIVAAIQSGKFVYDLSGSAR